MLVIPYNSVKLSANYIGRYFLKGTLALLKTSGGFRVRMDSPGECPVGFHLVILTPLDDRSTAAF